MDKDRIEKEVMVLCQGRLQVLAGELTAAAVSYSTLGISRETSPAYYSEIKTDLSKNGRIFNAIELPIFIGEKLFLPPAELAGKFEDELRQTLGAGRNQ